MAIHLEIKGIKGDSVADGYKDQIDCLSWNWGATNSSDAAQSTGMSQATSTVHNLNVVAMIGTASANLMHAACTGQHLGDVKLHCTKSDGKSTIEWLTLTLTNAFLTSCNQGGSSDDMGSDSVTFSFKKYQQQYFSQEQDGTKKNGPDKSYNVAEGKSES